MIREVIHPLDTKDQKGARNQKILVLRPGSKKWARQDLNLWPHGCEPRELELRP